MEAPNARPPTLLEASGLTLERGGRTLFKNLGLGAHKWGILLVTGPNGAGKSSLLQVLAGILRPDAGQLRWFVDDPESPRLHYLAHAPAVKAQLTVAENLQFWRQVNGPSGIAVTAALDRVGLGGLDDIEAGHLSAGQTRRLALARLLVSRRPVWLLDEPTAALDDAGHVLVGDMLTDHASSGGTVIAATHDKIPMGHMPSVLDLERTLRAAR